MRIPALAGLLLAAPVLAAGCLAAPPLAAFTGRACAEVAALLGADRDAAQALLPAGFALPDARGASADLPAGRALLVLGVDRCSFQAGSAAATEPEAFAWLGVEPPGQLRLPNGSHAFEVADWRPPGALADALAVALPTVRRAAITGAEGFAAGAGFDASVRGMEGGFRVNGTAAAPDQVLRHGAEPCCRTFASGPGGLVLRDYTSTDQPFGVGTCTVHATDPVLVRLVGDGPLAARCVHNAGYSFQARVGRG